MPKPITVTFNELPDEKQPKFRAKLLEVIQQTVSDERKVIPYHERLMAELEAGTRPVYVQNSPRASLLFTFDTKNVNETEILPEEHLIVDNVNALAVEGFIAEALHEPGGAEAKPSRLGKGRPRSGKRSK